MRVPEQRTGITYRQATDAAWGDLAIWDYLRFDGDGELWINDLRVLDAVRRYGTPLEIVDATIVERRAREWMELSRAVAEAVGYPGRMDYLYASKANMASEVVHAALRSGWGAETSSPQDLAHLEWLADHDLLPRDLRIVCNGFKLPPRLYGSPSSRGPDSRARVELPEDSMSSLLRAQRYADRIIDLARRKWRITPILDSGEVETFAQPGVPSMDVGLRLRCGPARSAQELDALDSRFGMGRDELRAVARRVAAAPHLRLTTLHAMVGAAQQHPMDVHVCSLLLAAEVWSALRAEYPSLTELNIGGGVPPLSELYDHRGFVRQLLTGLAAVAAKAGVPPPDVTFEFGSLIAAECGFHVFKVLQTKTTGASAAEATCWAIVDGGLMAAIPDMLFIDKEFRFLPVRGAGEPCGEVVIGDPTCDPDGRYPPVSMAGQTAVLLPRGIEEQYVLIQGVGAYQEILAGVRGAHHCGLLEAPELIIERTSQGQLAARLMPRQTWRDAAAVLGYAAEAVAPLRATMRAPD